MDRPSCHVPARLPALVAGFAAIYLIWGSTFLGIKYAVESFPPFLMAGSRFTLPGLALLFWLCWRGARPTLRQWGLAALTGALLLVGGNGLVTWGQQQQVPSGRAALLIATTPLWMALVGWLFYGASRPGLRVVVGIVAGFLGAALLVRPPAGDSQAGSLVGYLAILAAPISWVVGSHQTRRWRITEDVLLTSALQMVAGGLLMLLVGSLLGEWSGLAAATISARSVLAFGYLAVFGALVGFSVYAWLLRAASPTAVATYAYVNPLIAVLLGWLVSGEPLDQGILLAAGLILGAVLVITLPVTARARPVPRGVSKSEAEERKSLSSPRSASYTQEELTARAR